MKILILNGPNLNLLGQREPEIYGPDTLDDIEKYLHSKFPSSELNFFQSNIEGELVSKIQSAASTYQGLVINPAGYSHTSVAIYDALIALKIPVVEVHLSNPYKREPFRHEMRTAKAAFGVIAGFGKEGYYLALKYLQAT